MIEFNLSVPREIKDEIFSKRGEAFMIVTSSPMGDNKQYFLIKADEDDMLFLRLRYGSENVWKR